MSNELTITDTQASGIYPITDAKILHGVNSFKRKSQPTMFSVWIDGEYYGSHDTYQEAKDRFNRIADNPTPR